MKSSAAGQYARMVVGEFSRLRYGNDAGFSNNIRGERELHRLQARRPVHPAGTAAVTDARRLDREGWVEIDSGADPCTLELIRRRYDELIVDPDASVDLGFAPRVDAVRHVVDPVTRIPELAGLLNDRVVDVVRASYGTDVAVHSVRLWRTIHVPDSDLSRRGRFRRRRPVSVMANLFHSDQHPVSTLKYFVQLTPDVRADSGALRLLPIRSTRRVVRSGFIRPEVVLGPARRMIEANDDVVVFDGPPGAGLLCNVERCLHRAGIPKPGFERAMIQFMLVPSATPLPSNWAQTLRVDPDVEGALR